MTSQHHTSESLQVFLQQNNITFSLHHHKAVTTANDTCAEANLPGVTARNLFLRDKKRTMWLISLPLMLDAVDLKALRHQLGASGNLSFGDADLLWQHLGVRPGSVTPFAAINDTNHNVNVVIDTRLLAGPWVNAHPLVNTQTITVTPADLHRFFALTGHQVQVLQLPTQQAAA